MRLTGTRGLTTLALSVLVVAGCSSGSTATTTSVASTSTVATTSSTTTTTAATQAASDLEGVRAATFYVLAEGTFVDPDEGPVSTPWTGTGFFIDPSGVAVTNNHVVTGAAILNVYVEGEEEPRHAKVLGVSECSDLAVIEVEGDDFPYVEWYDGSITTGLDVYAAGFPLGDPEYTLTEGIISKEHASGQRTWSSVESVVEHTARVLPGNSGGPLVTKDGKVVGVNYSGARELDIQTAISRDEVLDVLDQLRSGENVDSIGINGRAFVSEDETLSGIWVSSVATGSPMAEIGVTGGDIITKMEDVAVTSDGSMSDYCDILRSHDASDPMTVEVLRFDTQEVLRGTLNSDEELTLAFSFADELGDETPAASGTYEYAEVYDDAETMYVQVPTDWADVDGSLWVVDGDVVGSQITAAPSINAFTSTWDTPGMFFGASDTLYELNNPGELLDQLEFSSDCEYGGRFDYDDGKFAGQYDLWTGCDGTATELVILEAWPATDPYVVLVEVQVVTDADLDALDTIITTFNTIEASG